MCHQDFAVEILGIPGQDVVPLVLIGIHDDRAGRSRNEGRNGADQSDYSFPHYVVSRGIGANLSYFEDKKNRRCAKRREIYDGLFVVELVAGVGHDPTTSGL